MCAYGRKRGRPRKRRASASAEIMTLLDIPVDELLRALYGEATPEQARRLRKMMRGARRMPVQIFWELYRVFSFIDLHRSLQDLTDVRLAWLARAGRKIPPEQRTCDLTNMLSCVTGLDSPEAHDGKLRQTPDSSHPDSRKPV
jgi:hypothetical protein